MLHLVETLIKCTVVEEEMNRKVGAIKMLVSPKVSTHKVLEINV